MRKLDLDLSGLSCQWLGLASWLVIINQSFMGHLESPQNEVDVISFTVSVWSAQGKAEETFPEFLPSGRIYKSAASKPSKPDLISVLLLLLLQQARGIEFLYVPLLQRGGRKTGRFFMIGHQRSRPMQHHEGGQIKCIPSWQSREEHLYCFVLHNKGFSSVWKGILWMPSMLVCLLVLRIHDEDQSQLVPHQTSGDYL